MSGAIRLALGFLVFAACGALGVILTREAGNAAVFWPANGAIAAMMLVGGAAHRSATLAGAVAANLALQVAAGDGALVAFGFTAANGLEIVLMALGLQRVGVCRRNLDDPRLIACLVMAAVAAAAAGGLIGGTTVAAAFGQPWSGAVLRWWASDAASALIVLPPILAFAGRPPDWRKAASPAGLAEGAGVAAVTVALWVLADRGSVPFAAAFSPLLLWLAFRFGVFWTAAAGSLIAVVLTLAVVLAAWSPAVGHEAIGATVLELQLTLMLIAVPPLFAAAAVQGKLNVVRQLKVSEERLALALEGSQDGLWDWHLPSGAVHFSDGWLAMLGYERHEVEPHISAWERLGHPDDRDEVWQRLRAHFAGETPVYRMEQRLRRKDGSYMWVLDRGKLVERDAAGAPIRAVGTVTNISDRKVREHALAHAATTDPLTGLANRAGLANHFEMLRGEDRSLALILVDLDRFKPINDTHGHAVGDAALQAVAERLRAATRTSDLVARLGGDEFVLLVETRGPREVVALRSRILAAINQPVEAAGRRFELGASLGTALYPAEAGDLVSLLEVADRRLYAEKRSREQIRAS